MRPAISIADLIRTIQTLAPDEEALSGILAMLNFEPSRRAAPPPLSPTTPASSRPSRGSAPPAKPKARRAVKRRETETVSLSVETIKETSSLQVHLPALPAPLPAESETSAPALEHIPLLKPQWTRAIITKLASLPVHEGPPDLTRLVELIARDQPVHQIPRLPLPTLRRGLQVLIDSGPGLMPYQRDQTLLLEALQKVVGEEQVTAWLFLGTPLAEAWRHNNWRHKGYQLPAPGTPVLVLTDLGIAAAAADIPPATEEDWLAFAAHVQAAGCHLIALLPYPPGRWPARLRDAMTLVQWDRHTSVGTVLRALS